MKHIKSVMLFVLVFVTIFSTCFIVHDHVEKEKNRREVVVKEYAEMYQEMAEEYCSDLWSSNYFDKN